MIEVHDVQHAYRHGGVVEPVLRGLDLRVERGEFVVVRGPSGCGKTTLLNILGLMMAPTRAASVCIDGQETLGLSDAARARLRRGTIGFVFQRFNLLPTISVRQNVALPLRLRGEAVDGQVDTLLERVGLQPYGRKKPGQLSVGQQQRVALARAVVGGPPVLLADEPTGSLDSANAQEVLGLMRELHRERGQTIVMITHGEQAELGADRVLRMRDGQFIE